VAFVEAANLDEAKRAVGLDPRQVDHGVVWRDLRSGGVSIVVYEFGLFVNQDRQRYFAINNQLFAGTAVLYGFDAAGETVDLRELPPVYFFGNAGEVERAIARRQINRPVLAVNDEVLWRWPEPPPADIAARMEEHDATLS
jgi:hypothetical protein